MCRTLDPVPLRSVSIRVLYGGRVTLGQNKISLCTVAFTAYDPEGLCIAATLPGFSRRLALSDECLNRLMVEINTERR